MRGKLRRKENGTHGRSAIIFGLALAAACVFAALTVEAEKTRFWRQSSFEEFDRGTAKGVALRSDGLLMLAPKLTEAEDPNAAYLWTLRADGKGNLYAGGGTNAKVVKYDAAGKTTTVFESQEIAAQALAVDAAGNLYVGTSPDGKVYKVTAAGEKSTFFEPKTKYIWDLAVGSDGTLYVATGDKGGLYAVGADEKGELIYSSEETHMRSLAFDGKGNLLIGTDPSGLILRLEPATGGQARPAKAGKAAAAATAKAEMRAFVVYETARKEVTSLVTDASGNLFAAAMGLKARTPTALPPTPVTPTPTPVQPGQTGQTPTTQTQRPPTQAPPFFLTAGGSAVYRIGPDGEPKELWSSNTELVYALGIGPDGKLVLGTGNDGRVVRLEGPNLFARVAKTSAAQVTGIAAGPGGKMFLCTANPGKVLTLGPETEAEGTFESQVYDARTFSEWGRLTWWGENGATDGAVALFARSGNTSNAEKNWSAWAGPFAGGMSEPVGSPAARFVQWKAVLTNKRGAAPTISWVSLAYLPRNVAPEIERIAMQEPGVRAQGFQPQTSGGGQQQPVQLRPPTRAPIGAGQGPRPQGSGGLPQGFRAKGWQAVLWSARDENDDELTFAIYFRGEGEKNWKLLKDEIAQPFYSWDTTTLPDGAYTLKIEASDAATNPPDAALKGWLESERFEVDNTPPQISGLSATPEGVAGAVRVKFAAMDATSVIERAEYSVDGGEWRMVYPAGRLSDARTEQFDFVVRGMGAGEHTVAVRVFDAFENTASAKVTIVVK